MAFDPVMAAIRYGFGLSPRVAPPASAEGMVSALREPDEMAARIVIPDDSAVRPTLEALRRLSRERTEARGTDGAEASDAAFQAARREMQETVARSLRSSFARATEAEDGLRERLVRFWADHFTLRYRNGLTAHLVTPYVETAIRPHVTGRFADMLRAAITHPMMLAYLDQRFSMGPNSAAAQRRDRGLNENLARELLELHTVGVGGPYDQTDVRELAELLTGLTYHPLRGTEYRADFAEPGAETVLGHTHFAVADMAVVEDALERLARHPATAAHLAGKLVGHFIGVAVPELEAAMAEVYLATDGALVPVVEEMLAHEAAWTPVRHKVKPPFDFIASGLRALDVPLDRLLGLSLRDTRRYLGNPMVAMGQTWEQPSGPDGWSEEAADWITPQGMAARIEWALTVPSVVVDLPDPRDFVRTALGAAADPAVVFAAGAAEDRADGIGVVLASAAFQRR